jgi:hypothetical protein
VAILRQSGGSATRSPLSEVNAESYDGLATGGTLQRVPRPQYTHRLNTCVNAKMSASFMSASFGILMLTARMAAAEPNITLYQLNCEKLAAETFRRETADFEDRVDYRAHYNARLRKCLYAETYISPTPVGINIWVYLSDLQGDRIYGGFHRSTNIGLFYCNIEDKECHSEAEWDELVKPYMED